MEKLVSIIIPSYNDTRYLGDAISSALSQTYKNIEVIVVNDGSTNEEDIEFFKNYQNPKVKIISKSNEGLAIARNTGINESKGEFFVPLDSDDKIKPSFLEETMSLMSEDVGVVYTDQEFFGVEDKVMPMKDFDFVYLLSRNHVSVCSLVRRSAYDEVVKVNYHGYNPNMKFGYEDWDLWISVAEQGWQFKCLHTPLFMYRKRDDSMSSSTIKNHDFLINQIVENHSDTYTKYSLDIIRNLQNLLVQQEMLNKNINKDSQNNGWLFKRMIKNISK
jgi:glycosyltransferase involved in cell wall biosynthesis